MRIDNQQQQNKGVMDLMPQTGAVEEKNGIQMFADAVKTESSKKSAGTTSFQAKEITYLNPAKEEKKTVIDEIEQSGSMDAGERKAQMAVLAETTSPEDYEKMQEDGFSLDDTTSNKIVTVTDKIKAQLAKAGVDISKFGVCLWCMLFVLKVGNQLIHANAHIFMTLCGCIRFITVSEC